MVNFKFTKLKILIVSYYFPPNGPAPGYMRAYEFAKFLKDKGHEVFVFTYWKSTDEFPHEYISKEFKHKYKRSSPFFKFFGWPDRNISFFLKGFFKFNKVLKKFSPDIVIISVPPFSSLFFAFLIPEGKYIIDFRDVWSADNLGLYRTKLQLWLSEKFERYLLKRALFSLCTNDNARDYLMEKHKFERIYTITHFAHNMECENSLNDLSICYIGSVERNYGLERVIKLLKSYGFRVKVRGYMREELGLKGVEFYKPAEFYKLKEWLCKNCSAILVSLSPYRNQHLVLMNKSITMFSFKKPILAILPEDNPAYEIYKKVGEIYLAKYGDDESILKAIRSLKEDIISQNVKVPKNIEQFKRENVLGRFYAILMKHLSRA